MKIMHLSTNSSNYNKCGLTYWWRTLSWTLLEKWRSEWAAVFVFCVCVKALCVMSRLNMSVVEVGSEVWLHDSVSFLCRPVTRLSACIYIHSYAACLTVWCIFYNPTQQKKRKGCVSVHFCKPQICCKGIKTTIILMSHWKYPLISHYFSYFQASFKLMM